MTSLLIIYILTCSTWFLLCCVDETTRKPFQKGYLTLRDIGTIFGWGIIGFIPIIGTIALVFVIIVGLAKLFTLYKDKPIITFKK